MAAESNNLEEILEPFYKRASEAEDRLANLEASLAGKADSGNPQHLNLIAELQSELETKNSEHLNLIAEHTAAQEKVKILEVENAKQKYRILHLLRALDEADAKLPASK